MSGGCVPEFYCLTSRLQIQFKIISQLIACYSQVMDKTKQEVKEIEDKIKNDELFV